MTEFEKQWIDNASYHELLAKVRFEPVGSPWLTGDTGVYLFKRWQEMKKVVGNDYHTRVSKELGWKDEEGL